MKTYLLGTLLLTLTLAPARADEVEWDTYPDTWVAVDELGRTVASSDQGVDRTELDPDATIGMFYYIWHKQHNTYNDKDITELLAENPDNPQWGPEGYFHWGSTPWLGRYTAGDAYVVAKHMQMLVDAGVDFLFFDCTNAVTYTTQVRAVMAEIDRRVELGMKAPKLAFMVHSNAVKTMTSLYNSFYKSAKYDKYWYCHNGKPLMLGPVQELKDVIAKGQVLDNDTSLEEAILDRFTFRNSWAWMQGQNAEEWSWLEYCPQKPGYVWAYNDRLGMDTKKFEQISVSVAQHATTKVGKSYHDGKQPAIDKYGMCAETPYGYYFQEQWDEAISRHVPVVMVTQFNEWVAQRFIVNSSSDYGATRPGATPAVGESYFVDVYNPEFSRDLEPSRAPAIRDNYYLQLVSNVRRYRGVNPIPLPTRNISVAIDGDFSQWDAETTEYRDDKGDVAYTSTAVQSAASLSRASNDIVRCKVTKDAANLYFYVETLDPLSAYESSSNWMRLLLNTDCDYTTGWHGYDYLVGRDEATGSYSLMRCCGGFAWQTVATVAYRADANKLHLAIPRSSVGHDGIDADIDFKWVDNVAWDDPDIMEFISEGDAAPNGRFNYRYKGAQLATAALPTVAGRERTRLSARVEGGAVVFDNASAALVDIYSIVGQKLRSVGANVATTLSMGIYLARCGDETVKFMIR